MSKFISALLASSIVLTGLSVANADDDRYEKQERCEHSDDDRHEYRGKYHDKHKNKSAYQMKYMFKRLDLNEEQKKQVETIRESYKPKLEALREKMKNHRQQLHEFMHNDNMNQEKVSVLANQIGDLKTKKIILRTNMRAEIHKVFTDEQRNKLKNLKKHHKREHKKGYHS